MERVSYLIQFREPVAGASRTDWEPKFTLELQGERSSNDCTVEDESVVLAGNVTNVFVI